MFKRTKKEQVKSGGLAFYLSLFALFLICACNLFHLPQIWDLYALRNWLRFGFGCVVGVSIAAGFIHGRLNVMLHEAKHATLSLLVGNKSKGLKIKKGSGHYKYSYTKKTEHFNAMISLAPYWLPLTTVPLFLFGLTSLVTPRSLLVIIGIGYGIDTTTGIREIHPDQTDLTSIRGGRGVAILYVILCHLAVLTILGAWVSQGVYGLKYILFGLWRMTVGIVGYYYSTAPV